jgi:hypothetical protein
LLAKQLFGYAIVGFALTKTIVLFALMMAFWILFVFQFVGVGILGEINTFLLHCINKNCHVKKLVVL